MAIPADPEQLAAFIQQQVAAALAAAAAQPAPAPAIEPLPAHNIKPATPGSFSGTLREDVDLWIWTVRHWLEAGRVQHELERLSLATGLLQGPALAWWRFREQQPGAPLTFDALAGELKINFQPVNPVDTMRNLLADLKQKATVLEYATDFRNIAIGIPGITDDEMKDRFIRGLLPRTKEELVLRAPTSFSEAVQLAVRFDSLYKPRRHRTDFGELPDSAVPMELGSLASASSVQAAQARNFRQSGRPQPRPNRGNARPKLAYQKQQQLRKEGKCFWCQKTGHMWRECPARQQQQR
jgi:hypothetical protein